MAMVLECPSDQSEAGVQPQELALGSHVLHITPEELVVRLVSSGLSNAVVPWWDAEDPLPG